LIALQAPLAAVLKAEMLVVDPHRTAIFARQIVARI
jgi:hypothetical protein